jgi:hypothetical protein
MASYCECGDEPSGSCTTELVIPVGSFEKAAGGCVQK